MPPALSAQPIAPPPEAAQPQVGQAGQGDMNISQQMAPPQDPSMAPSPMEANAGIFDQLRQLNMQLTDANSTLEAIATQFPAAAESIRQAMQALEVANKSLIDVLTAVISQSQEQQPMSPRIIG